ncbi:transporter substrate-binding domain-containing protein [Variovorax sp. J22P240]|uniref:transporter substrate-binding domain-containing protein n=1 Tax=Variovorax sp. J22P240 TaxID=3053514 RepID=UPI002575B315|nr:transporter substrate-binding domain-containing protein [Variovorax sp. J22P240]MDM0002745.1 transporter substrate-binding domain-containing protein [Variovorax sp. J22P240]
MDSLNVSNKRDFLKGTALLGTAATGLATTAVGLIPQQALAQSLDSGIRPESTLAKVLKSGVLRVGYAQTGPFFYKNAKTGELGGIYFDAATELAKQMGVKVEFKEVTFQNATVALRRDDYDVFGSALTYTMARAMAVDYIGPIYEVGSLLLVHKDNSGRFKKLEDFNDPSVTFSVVSGGSEEPRIPVLFPKAKLITTTGQAELGAEPVRAKKSDVWMSSQVAVQLMAKRVNWAMAFEPNRPIDRRPSSWAVRYGDYEWKNFLDFWAGFLRTNGETERLMKVHMERLGNA